MLTPNQLQELNRLIDQKVTLFIGQNISTELLNAQEKTVLKNAGVDIEKIEPKDLLIYQSFATGLISGVVPKSVLNATTYAAFKDYISTGKFIPLNSYEKGVIRSLEKQSLADIKGIGERYKSKLQGGLNKAERQYYEDTLRRNIKEGIARKDSLKNISNDIAKELDAFGRDFDRIVQTVSHQAFDEGRQAFIQRNYGNDAKFYYQVYEGACSICVGDYLTAGLGSKPKVFKLGELPPPQVNYGVKKADRVVTQAPAHPMCRCTLMFLGEGYVWNEEKKEFMPSKDQPKKVERKSKVKIQFGDKEYEV